MKWSRAVHHVESLARSCAEMATRPVAPLRVVELWAVGDLLGGSRDLDSVTVAAAVDVPAAGVAWWTEPAGARHWCQATRVAQQPVQIWWRSVHAPVWNHRIQRPVLLWDVADGVREEALAALRAGDGASMGTPAPTVDEFVARIDAELAVSLAALRDRTEAYDRRRWSPGRLEPVADALWECAGGYLDVRDAADRAASR